MQTRSRTSFPELKLFRRLGAAAFVAAYMAVGQVQADERAVVVATTGGVFEQTLKETWFEPFTEATGIEVKTVAATDAEQRTQAQAMFQSDNVTWDAIINVDVIAESSQNRAFTQDLTEFCRKFTDRPDLRDKACNPAGVRISFNGTLLAFDQTKFEADAPATWADLWDVDTFPGPRALPNFGDPWRVFAAALMADGVAPDALFPLDIDRAIAKLDEIRPHVQLWWRTGDQSQQGFRNGDYAVGMIWGTRANALKDEGLPVGVSYQGAFMLADTMQVLRNAPNTEGVLALLEYYLDNPSVQARFAEKFTITPPSTKAVELMSAEKRERLPTSPDVLKTIVRHDPQWISANQSRMLEIWNTWLQQ